MKITAIICAAGRGERAALGKNKALAPLYGAPVLWHTLKKFSFADEILVTCSPCDRGEIAAISAPFSAVLAEGGKTRAHSVYNALKRASGDVVLIHDGARPFVSEKVIADCIESVKTYGSGVCALPATDTVVLAEGGKILSAPERSGVFTVQTPQGFYTADVLRAYESAAKSEFLGFTDDSSIYAKFIAPPRLFIGDRANIKLTYPEDFLRDERGIFGGQFKNAGFGVDVHAFGDGDKVTLCGVKIDCDKGLIAHSDGDVAAHAVMDALLSAAGLRDIGFYFPDSDEKWRGADSMKMLKEVVRLVKEAGFAPNNLSLSIQAEKPRLAAHIEQIKKNLSEVTGADEKSIAVAAGTCEKLGFVGEGLGIAAYCAVTVKAIN